MNYDTLNKAARIAWAGLGIFVDREEANANPPAIYFSVPEHSYHKNANGIEMAGDFLAKRIKTTAIESGIPAFTKFLYKIRPGDNWTEGNKNQAEIAMRACFETHDQRPFDAFRRNHANEWKAPAAEFDRGSQKGHRNQTADNIFDAIKHTNFNQRTSRPSSEPIIIETKNYAEE